jgi:hypothetical protein
MKFTNPKNAIINLISAVCFSNKKKVENIKKLLTPIEDENDGKMLERINSLSLPKLLTLKYFLR